MNILGQDAFAELKTLGFAVAETPGFPSLRAWHPGEDKQVCEKEAQKKLPHGRVA